MEFIEQGEGYTPDCCFCMYGFGKLMDRKVFEVLLNGRLFEQQPKKEQECKDAPGNITRYF